MELVDRNLEEISKGFVEDDEKYICVFCGKVFEKNRIFPVGEKFYNAKGALDFHIANCHESKTQELINKYDKLLSLTERQKELMELFSQNKTDKEVSEILGISQSTVRHQKFTFREKAKAAKIYLAIYQWIQESGSEKLIDIHGGATMLDDRYIITEDESKKILDGVCLSQSPLKLKVFSSKEKRKIVILRRIMEEFEKDRVYTEKEINDILGNIYHDFATIRRYLVEYGYMERTKDCREYRVK